MRPTGDGTGIPLALPISLPVPLAKVLEFAYDLGQFIPFFRSSVERLPHPSDLHLLDDHHQEESRDDHDDQECPEPKAKPLWPIIFRHGDQITPRKSESRAGCAG